jgi:hypothetical protein
LDNFIEITAENRLNILSIVLGLKYPEQLVHHGVVIAIDAHKPVDGLSLAELRLGLCDLDANIRFISALFGLLGVLIVNIDLVLLFVGVLNGFPPVSLAALLDLLEALF